MPACSSSLDVRQISALLRGEPKLICSWIPPPASALAGVGVASPAYGFMQLTAVVLIAYAGVMANLKLLPLLRELSGSALVARKVVFAWLAGNLLLGSQLCWNLRPFIGN